MHLLEVHLLEVHLLEVHLLEVHFFVESGEAGALIIRSVLHQLDREIV